MRMRAAAIVCLVLTAATGPAAPNVYSTTSAAGYARRPGFAQVTPETAWDAERAFGWLNDPADMRAYQATRIDGLAIDEISGLYNRTGRFRVDLPDGEYTVWVLSGAMGNIWRQRYMRDDHSLLINGDLAETISYPRRSLRGRQLRPAPPRRPGSASSAAFAQ